MVALPTRTAARSERTGRPRQPGTCLHCGSPIGSAAFGGYARATNDGADRKSGATGDAGTERARSDDQRFCCRGCEEVHALLTSAGLDRFYELGGGDGHPVVRSDVDLQWLELVRERLDAAPGLTRIVLDVQGMHCSACVWLFEALFRRRDRGRGSVLVNPAIGSIELTIDREFPLESYVDDLTAVGYRLGPSVKRESERDGDLLWRMGVCIAIAMNTMIFGFAIYCGLSEGPVYRLFHALDFGLSFVGVLVGGSVFFRSAWQSLRRGMLHLDVPIALGIVLVFASSTLTYVQRGGSSSYFDTLNVFVALMLVGRFLQERVVSRNRAMLLSSEGEGGLLTRRVTRAGDGVELVRCTEVAEGDALLVAHRDLVPVDATLEGDSEADFSLDWISGESGPRTFAPGDVVPAGAFLQSAHAVTMRARGAFDASSVRELLRASTQRDADMARATGWHTRLSRVYVVTVLALGAAAFAVWMIATGDFTRTLDVVAGLLIVTCPCAFGIATPLAYELAQAALRRRGLFVRTPGFLDRAAEIRRIVFDKTGTLTTGQLEVRDPSVLTVLSPEHASILYTLAARSSHPKSRAVARSLERLGPPAFEPDVRVREVPGKGLECSRRGHTFRLGSPAWALAPARIPSLTAGRDLLFTEDGAPLANVVLDEEVREDVAVEIAELHRAGYETFVLSGDDPTRVRAMAERCGIPEERAYGGRTPEGKATWLREHPGKALFIGDGINDSLVAEDAYCAGTPAIDRPFMASRCDFYFVTAGLRPIREALAVANRLAGVIRSNLFIALFYNAITVTLAFAGQMTPLLCAVLMPVSSVTTVLWTTARMSSIRGRASWKS